MNFAIPCVCVCVCVCVCMNLRNKAPKQIVVSHYTVYIHTSDAAYTIGHVHNHNNYDMYVYKVPCARFINIIMQM